MSEITKIREERVKDDGDWEEWPYPTVTITSAVSGDLRARILKLTGREDGTVTIEEKTVSGGHSEYTQEDECSIRVLVDGSQVWNQENAMSADSAMAAFLRWAS